MPTQIHPIAVVIDGARNSAHIRAPFQNDGMNVRVRQEFVRGGQAGRPGANDDGCFLGHSYVASSGNRKQLLSVLLRGRKSQLEVNGKPIQFSRRVAND